jgi:thiamine biosynthesis lipoprotein
MVAHRPGQSVRDDPAGFSFQMLGMSASVLTVHSQMLEIAASMLQRALDELDRTCSRFRPDSELMRVEQTAGRWVAISGLLTDLLASAIHVAQLTDGMVDPTVGAAVAQLGYDRDFAFVAREATTLPSVRQAVPGWQCIELDADRRMLRLPPAVHVDLGSSAKAFAVDQAAKVIADASGSGVLVNVGGDIAVSGEPPVGGWRVGLAPSASAAPRDTEQVISIRAGGLASSGTTVRTWRRGDRTLHHIVDPRTGDVAVSDWLLVSVAAPSCLLANAGSTAAIVDSSGAIDRLTRMQLPARLVAHDATVTTLGGWPTDRWRPLGKEV